MACHSSLHILVLSAPRSSRDLAFMVIFIAISMGLAIAISVPLAAINSISRQATKRLSQICASFLNLLLNFITFTVQTSLNLLKHIIEGFGGSVSRLVARCSSTIENWINDWIADLLSKLFSSAASQLLDLLKTVISKSVNTLFSSLTKAHGKLPKDEVPNPEGVGAPTSIIYNLLASIASSFVNALKDQATRLLQNGVPSVYERMKEVFLEKWKQKLESMAEFILALSSLVSLMRDFMRLLLRATT